MRAVKGNRSYSIMESEKASYIKQGFDIKDDTGNVIAYGSGKMVAYESYKTLETAHKDLILAYQSLEDSHQELMAKYQELEGKVTVIKTTNISGMKKDDLEVLINQFKEEFVGVSTSEV